MRRLDSALDRLSSLFPKIRTRSASIPSNQGLETDRRNKAESSLRTPKASLRLAQTNCATSFGHHALQILQTNISQKSGAHSPPAAIAPSSRSALRSVASGAAPPLRPYGTPLQAPRPPSMSACTGLDLAQRTDTSRKPRLSLLLAGESLRRKEDSQ